MQYFHDDRLETREGSVIFESDGVGSLVKLKGCNIVYFPVPSPMLVLKCSCTLNTALA